jgi:hypothetical protein
MLLKLNENVQDAGSPVCLLTGVGDDFSHAYIPGGGSETKNTLRVSLMVVIKFWLNLGEN